MLIKKKEIGKVLKSFKYFYFLICFAYMSSYDQSWLFNLMAGNAKDSRRNWNAIIWFI